VLSLICLSVLSKEGERSTRYFFELEEKQGENKMWNRIKNTEGKYKYDIDSIIDEQIQFYSPFTNPFWSECINFGKTTFNLSARIFAIIL
jgi:hypothetical protein